MNDTVETPTISPWKQFRSIALLKENLTNNDLKCKWPRRFTQQQCHSRCRTTLCSYSSQLFSSSLVNSAMKEEGLSQSHSQTMQSNKSLARHQIAFTATSTWAVSRLEQAVIQYFGVFVHTMKRGQWIRLFPRVDLGWNTCRWCLLRIH